MKKKLQVFVSSTYTDLLEERQAAVGAILKAGHIPAGMELFTAGDQKQLEIIKRWIDESDIYMLILGGRYGTLEPTSGLSYTELEYDYALSIGKPLFAVVIREHALEEKVKKFGTSVIETNNSAALKLFREKALGNMSAFYEDCKDIKLAVMESVPELAATRDVSGWISGKEVPDTKGLVDEVTKLAKEVASLQKENAQLRQKVEGGKKAGETERFEETIALLSKIDIDIHPDLAGGKRMKVSLFDIFVLLKDEWVTGVSNRTGLSDGDYFLFNNVCPTLQIHDLMQLDKVAGVQWRRFQLTKLGAELLAYVGKKEVLEGQQLTKVTRKPPVQVDENAKIKPETKPKASRKSKTAATK